MSEQTLYAGFHCMKVEPPMGIHVPGYYEKRYSDGFLTDLHIRACAFKCGEEKAIVYTVEAIGINAAAFNLIKGKIAERCQMDENAIYINCIHSHTAYRITPYGTDDIDDNDIFMMRLYQQLTDCAQFAFEDLKPCTLKIARGEARDVGFIRRYRMADGTCKTNPGIGNPDIVSFVGEQDHSVQLIRVDREEGKDILMVNFGTHADVIGGTKYCADWPGYLADNLSGAFGNEVETMVLLGAEGDSNHINAFLPKGSPRKGVEVAKRMARIIAGEVLKIYDSAQPVESGKIACFTQDVQIGKNAYDPADIPEAEKIRDIYVEKGNKAPELKDFKLNVPEALRILANLKRPEFFNLRVHGLQIGNVAFIGYPGEPFTQIGRAVKEHSKMDMTFVTACTNGGEGYYPDEAAFAEAGYERSASPFASNCAEIMIGAGNAMTDAMEKI